MVEPTSLLQELLNDFHPEKNDGYKEVKTGAIAANKRRASNFFSSLTTPDSSPQKSDRTPEEQAQHTPAKNKLDELNQQIKKITRHKNGTPRDDRFKNFVRIARQEAERFRKEDLTLAIVKTDSEFKLLTVKHLVNLFKDYQSTLPENSVTPADVIMNALESARAEALDQKVKNPTEAAIQEAQKPIEKNGITATQITDILDNLCNNFKLPIEITDEDLAQAQPDDSELKRYQENYQDYIELNTPLFKEKYTKKLYLYLQARADNLLKQNQFNLKRLVADLTKASIEFRNQEFNDLRNFIDNKILAIDSVVSQPEQDTESEALKNNPELTFVLAIKNRLNWHIDISKFDYPLTTEYSNSRESELASQLSHIRHTYDAFEDFFEQHPGFLTDTPETELPDLLIPMCAKLVDACAKLGKPDCHLKASIIDQLITIIKYENQSTKAAESITANTRIESKAQALLYARKILCSKLHDNYIDFALLPDQAEQADYLQITLTDQETISALRDIAGQEDHPEAYSSLEDLSYADILAPELTKKLFTKNSKPVPKIKKSSEDYQVYYEEQINGNPMVHHAMSASLKAKRFVKSSSRFSQRPNLLLAAKLDFIHRINQEKEKLRQQAQNNTTKKTNTEMEAAEETKESHSADGITQNQLLSPKDSIRPLPDSEKILDHSDTATTASMTTITTTTTTTAAHSSNISTYQHQDNSAEERADVREHKPTYLTSDKLLELFHETKQHLSSKERQLPDSFPKDYRDLLAAPRNASLFTWPRIRWTESEAVAPMLLDQTSLEAELDYYQHLFNILPGSRSINQETGKILSAKEMIQDYFDNNTVSFKNYILCTKLLFMSLAAKQQDNTQTSKGLAILFNMVKGQMANFNQTSQGATKLTQHYGHLFGTIQSAGLACNYKELLATHRNFFKRVMLGKKLKTKGSKQTKEKILSQDKLQAKLDELMLELDKLPDVDPRDSLNKKIETVLLDSKKAPSFKHYILCMKTYFLHESATYEPTPAEINEQNTRPTEHNFQTRLNARLEETVEHFQKKFTLTSEYQETIQAAETQEIVSEGTASSVPDDSHNKEAMNKFHQSVFRNECMHEYTHFMTLGTGYFSGFGGHFRISKKGTETTRVLNEYQPRRILAQAFTN